MTTILNLVSIVNYMSLTGLIRFLIVPQLLVIWGYIIREPSGLGIFSLGLFMMPYGSNLIEASRDNFISY